MALSQIPITSKKSGRGGECFEPQNVECRSKESLGSIYFIELTKLLPSKFEISRSTFDIRFYLATT